MPHLSPLNLVIFVRRCVFAFVFSYVKFYYFFSHYLLSGSLVMFIFILIYWTLFSVLLAQNVFYLGFYLWKVSVGIYRFLIWIFSVMLM